MGEKRSYGQYCTVARALDVVGERWTLLLVRELSTGPKRFKDLLEGLPGIGTNLLANRLKTLEGEGIVRRATLPPPAGSNVYELTELGGSLDPVIVALSRWGARLLDAPREEEDLRAGWAAVAMRSAIGREVAGGRPSTYEFRIDGEAFHVRVRDGEEEWRSHKARSRIPTWSSQATPRPSSRWPPEGLAPRRRCNRERSGSREIARRTGKPCSHGARVWSGRPQRRVRLERRGHPANYASREGRSGRGRHSELHTGIALCRACAPHVPAHPTISHLQTDCGHPFRAPL
jgi:DNA-binding HxlR family transcriptional regulator